MEFLGANATIKGPSGRVQSYFDCSGATNITFRGLVFDQLKASLPTYTSSDYAGGPLNVPIYMDGGEGLSVVDCTFNNLYTTAIYFDSATGLKVTGNKFSSGTQTQDQWMQHIHLQTCSDVFIDRNDFINAAPASAAVVPAGIYGSGMIRLTITNNYMKYCGRDNTGTHRVGAIDIYGDCETFLIENNVLDDCMAVAMRINAVKDGVITKNTIKVNAAAELDGNTIEVTGVTLFGGIKGATNIEVSHNTIEDPDQRAATSILIAAYDFGYPCRQIKVRHNTFSSSRKSVVAVGGWDGIRIENNKSGEGAGQIAAERLSLIHI